jgi:hypothetical protein
MALTNFVRLTTLHMETFWHSLEIYVEFWTHFGKISFEFGVVKCIFTANFLRSFESITVQLNIKNSLLVKFARFGSISKVKIDWKKKIIRGIEKKTKIEKTFRDRSQEESSAFQKLLCVRATATSLQPILDYKFHSSHPVDRIVPNTCSHQSIVSKGTCVWRWWFIIIPSLFPLLLESSADEFPAKKWNTNISSIYVITKRCWKRDCQQEIEEVVEKKKTKSGFECNYYCSSSRHSRDFWVLCCVFFLRTKQQLIIIQDPKFIILFNSVCFPHSFCRFYVLLSVADWVGWPVWCWRIICKSQEFQW